MNYLKEILELNKNGTLFTVLDAMNYVGGASSQDVYSALSYAVKRNQVIRITKGIYSFSKDYSKKEFANKFRRPSYVSLYTVLQECGIVFQPYESIFALSNRSENIIIDNQRYIYRQVKDDILLNPMGISNIKSVNTASVERAICDVLYLDGDQFFDNLRGIDWNFMSSLNEQVYSINKVISNFIQKNKA